VFFGIVGVGDGGEVSCGVVGVGGGRLGLFLIQKLQLRIRYWWFGFY